MASKRTATSDLNHDNWDNEDEPEVAGTFVKAPPDVLEKRVVRSARRRLPRSGDTNAKSAFGLFAGFKTTPAASPSPFSFLAKANASAEPSTVASTPTRSNASTASNGARKIPENGSDESCVKFPSMETDKTLRDTKKLEGSENEDRIFKKSSVYFAKLKGLNESVTSWIKSHVDSNPFCILTPIFRDYERYLKDIEAGNARDTRESKDDEIILEKPLATSSKLSSFDDLEKTKSRDATSDEKKLSIFEAPRSSAAASDGKNLGSKKGAYGVTSSGEKFSFDGATEKSAERSIFGGISTENNPFLKKTSSITQINENTEKSMPDKSSGYMSFGSTNSTSATFSFGQSSNAASAPTAGFSFGSAKPFSFGSYVAAPQNSETKADNEEKEENDDDEEPPKPDFKPTTEEGAFFEKRCKVFVKKDGNFSDRGIGVLFLKSTPNDKTQLIVRADNSLGNLLLNTLLTESIPTKRMNKNTVMLVCLPLPDSEPPPTPILLRVKTTEDADNLIETLDNNKK